MKNKSFLKVVSANAYMKDVRLNKQQAIFILILCLFFSSFYCDQSCWEGWFNFSLKLFKHEKKILVLKLDQDMKKHINKQGNEPS